MREQVYVEGLTAPSDDHVLVGARYSNVVQLAATVHRSERRSVLSMKR